MRVLLSTIGSRGDVQPLVALALQLQRLQQDVRLCVPPDFREWIEGLGIPVTQIGPDVRQASRTAAAAPRTPEQLRQLAEASVTAQFHTILATAQGYDVVLAATALQIAAHSVAELLRIPYVFVAYCPTVLPSPHHAPIRLTLLGQTPAPAAADNCDLWLEDARRWNDTWGHLLNAHRASLGLAPVRDVRNHIFTDRPWLAADPILAPWPDAADPSVVQTGAWVTVDERPLPSELEAFLDSGEPPVYFGFGSMTASDAVADVMLRAARALGRRAIVSSGWANLSLAEVAPDCLVIGEVNQQTLFKWVAAVVHHGGAGTTTAAGLAGVPQVVIPQMYDQHYWAKRVQQLEIGSALAPGTPTTSSLTTALQAALRPEVAARARQVSGEMRTDGAAVAAQQLIDRLR